MKILISGHNGFIGKHLIRKLKCKTISYEIDYLDKSDFESPDLLMNKISSNDIIFHFAGINRSDKDKEVYEKNNKINDTLFLALEKNKFNGKLLFTSSTQEDSGTYYGKAKKEARLKFEEQSKKLNYKFYGIITPNIFGPFCKPNYNSFISTFSYELINGKNPKIQQDQDIDLIYINDFIDIITSILNDKDSAINLNDYLNRYKVSDILKMLENFHKTYFQDGNIPSIMDYFELSLFNTFRSYIDYENYFPIKHKKNIDIRGSFSELTRAFSLGQTSYSISNQAVVRGNHFHTRKIERFSVIKGKAKITLREVLSSHKIDFILDGNNPSYVDMPIWYTHSIENIGDGELITIFWTNEHYNEDSSDTYLENV